jgi:WXG100 family type VII secretion target
MSDAVKVQYEALQTAHLDIQGAWNQISQQAEDLRTFVKNFADNWQGAASTSYQAQQTQFDQAINDMAGILNQIGTAVSVANDNYSATENANKGMFS